MAKTKNNDETTGANVGYEAQLWQMADALRGSMDAAEYKHVCLGLLFLKYISDAFEERHAALLAEKAKGADPEDPDEYRAQSIFWVPPEARWPHLKAQARQATIGQLVDDAMAGIERDNPALKGVLPRDYARPVLDKTRLGQLIDLVSNIKVGDAASRAKDQLGRVYEYFLKEFAGAEGKKGGEFYTPRCVVKLLVEMLEPYRGRVYDPCCGSSGMFVQSVEFIRAHAKGNGNGGKAKADISIEVDEAWVSRERDQYSCVDDEYDARVLSWLIDVLLLKRPAPWPESGEGDEAVRQWSLVGRAMLAHDEDGRVAASLDRESRENRTPPEKDS